MTEWRCSHCGTREASSHQDEHRDLCCDCFDLSCGKPLELLNEKRARNGKAPIKDEWPKGKV